MEAYNGTYEEEGNNTLMVVVDWDGVASFGHRDPWIMGCQLFVCLASIAMLVPSARLVYQRTDLRHPLYAVLMQDVAALIVSSSLSTLATLSALVMVLLRLEDTGRQMFTLARLFTPLANQFHQLSWLVITCLRLGYVASQ